MDVATRKKLGVDRQTTFGPSAPIDEWELEKATLLREAKENKERADRLQQKLEQDQLNFERNTAKLLKEVRLKEASWEKRSHETDTGWMNQVLELQQQLDLERQTHEDIIKDTKLQMEHTLQVEQKKYDRRMANLQSRLDNKEKMLQNYLSNTQEQQAQQQSDILPSPVTPFTPISIDHLPSTNVTSSDANQDTSTIHALRQQIQGLEQQLIKQKRRNDQLEHQQQQQRSLTTIDSTLPPTSSPATTNSFENSERAALESAYNRKMQVLIDQHAQEQQRLRDNFMNENSALTMHMEARLQNIQNEYENTIQEIRDQFATEKSVWHIEQQTAMDQLKRHLEQQYSDQQTINERVWRDKLNDMEMSLLGKDEADVRIYWQTKIDKLTETNQREMERQRGELDVVKSRLGKDIDRRHQVQAHLAALQSKYDREHTAWLELKQELSKLRQQNSTMQKEMQQNQKSIHLAASLYSTLSMDENDENTCKKNLSASLIDLLQLSLRKATLLQTKKTTQEMILLLKYDDSFCNDPFGFV